jgi:hypothetical protein
MNRYYFEAVIYPKLGSMADYVRKINLTAPTQHAARRMALDRFHAADEFVRNLKLVREKTLEK